jgi:glycosyltransferase involved in cell wall biosynthesis
MAKAHRISIVLATYNRANFIGAAVASVLGQSYKDFELLVVDDGSTDNTQQVLAKINDSRLRIIRQPNSGRSRALNVGLQQARGEYIGFQHPDDLYFPHKLAAVYTAATCNDEKRNSPNFEYRASVSGNIYPSVAFFQPVTIPLSTVMIRRHVLDKVGLFDEALHHFEDNDLCRRIAKRYPLGAIDEVTCSVRMHSDDTLENQDPGAIMSALNHYVSKVMEEDVDVRSDILEAGAHRLLGRYGLALTSLPSFADAGRTLIEKAKLYFLPKVSIIIPVYNGGDYLREAIDSALAQTYRNTEVIVVNDGSTDGGITEAIARSYGNRIRYASKPNGGVASALNRGIKEMSGELFSWLSHDDLYLPDKIARQIAVLAEQPQPFDCIVYGDFSVFSSSVSSAVPLHLPQTAPEAFRYFITEQNVLHGCTLLVPKSAFEQNGTFNETLRTTQDYDLWFRLAATHRFIHTSTMGVLARSHEDQGTRRMKDTVLIECDELLGGFVECLSSDELRRGASKAPAEALVGLAYSLAQRGFFGASRRALAVARSSVRESITDLISTGNLNGSHLAALEDVEGAIRVAEPFASERLEKLYVAAFAQRAEAQGTNGVRAISHDQIEGSPQQAFPARVHPSSKLGVKIGPWRILLAGLLELRRAEPKTPSEALFELAYDFAQRGLFNASQRALDLARSSVRASITDLRAKNPCNLDGQRLAALENVGGVVRLTEFASDRLEALLAQAEAQANTGATASPPDRLDTLREQVIPLLDPSSKLGVTTGLWSRSLILAKVVLRHERDALRASAKIRLKRLWRNSAVKDRSTPKRVSAYGGPGTSEKR